MIVQIFKNVIMSLLNDGIFYMNVVKYDREIISIFIFFRVFSRGFWGVSRVFVLFVATPIPYFFGFIPKRDRKFVSRKPDPVRQRIKMRK